MQPALVDVMVLNIMIIFPPKNTRLPQLLRV
jgi:hypothetical protein